MTIRTLLAFLFVVTAFSSVQAENTSPLVPQDLRCEYLVNPQGLDVRQPRFSWVYSFPEDKMSDLSQTAYRIRVAGSLVDLTGGKSVDWDSGWVKSNQTSQLVYSGKPLVSDRIYYWTVSQRDNCGRESTSSPAFWTTGLFEPSEWTGHWIGNGKTYTAPGDGMTRPFDPQFRRTFELNACPDSALLHLASIGYHQVWVNGREAGNCILAPAVSNYTKRVLYNTYDIAPLLVKGKNVIAVHLGTGWSIYSIYATADRPAAPLFRAQANIRCGKQTVKIVTDPKWKTEESDYKLLGRWFPGQFCGEYQDGARSCPNWNTVTYDDSFWKPVVTVDLKRELSGSRCESNILSEPIQAVAIDELPTGKDGKKKWRVDMGVNFAGWTEINVAGTPGDVIEFQFSELKEVPSTFNLFSRYKIGPSGKGTFRNRFNYSSGRWITVSGLSGKPALSDFRGWNIRTGFRRAATFDCNDGDMNWVNRAVLHTFDNLTLGGYIVDCSSRERMGYGGDAHATKGTGLYQYDLAAFYSKWLRDWRDVQGYRGDYSKEDTAHLFKGQTEDVGKYFLPNTAPTCWGGGGPAWGSIVTILPLDLYRQYGDIRVLEENFDMMAGWLKFLDAYTTDGLMRRYSPYYDYGFLGDWLWPGATGNPNSGDADVLCFNNMFRIYSLQCAAETARILGRTEQALQWEQAADQSRKAVHKKYYNAKQNSYFNGWMPLHALALLANVPPVELRDSMNKRLEEEIQVHKKGHIGGGITGGAVLFRYLREQHRDDLLYTMISKTDAPGWLFMRSKGDTIWEAWERNYDWHTCLHSSYLYPGAWFIDSVLGIRSDPSTPGFRKIVIQPPKYNDLPIRWAKGSFNAPTGTVSVHWQKNADEKVKNDKENKFEMTVSIPPNTTATVYVPTVGTKQAVCDSRLAVFKENRPGYSVFQMRSGTCHFR